MTRVPEVPVGSSFPLGSVLSATLFLLSFCSRPEASGFPTAGIIGGCELPYTGETKLRSSAGAVHDPNPRATSPALLLCF